MADQELADKVVPLVGGQKSNMPLQKEVHYRLTGQVGSHFEWMLAEQFVRDARVMLALMEKCSMIFIENTPGIWACRADKCYGNRTREWYHDESQPRVITEACVEALTND